MELLIAQTERANELQSQLENKEKQLKDLNVKIASLGSIAEASLELHGIFKSAQDSADMYMNAAKKRAVSIVEYSRKKGEEIIAEAKKEAARIKGEDKA